MSHKNDRKGINVVILCEDEYHYGFIKNYMVNLGFSKYKIKPICAPSGKGSGKQFVKDNYAKRVKAYRSRKNNLSLILVVIIDADEQDISDIKNNLDISLGKEKRELDENIAIFIPKWHIETWMFYLETNEEVDENKRYKNKVTITPNEAAKKLYEICKNSLISLPENAPSSLKIACGQELKRLDC